MLSRLLKALMSSPPPAGEGDRHSSSAYRRGRRPPRPKPTLQEIDFSSRGVQRDMLSSPQVRPGRETGAIHDQIGLE
jgi:hypothetical protein